jgi:diguanylate cyclase (GGDEF)-like protein
MDLLQKQAVTDQLTGLPNRREFLEVMDEDLGSNENLSVLMLDIDHFKVVNDTYGHDAGDEVLSVLAKVGTAVTNKVGLFARWGGEEFVVALPHTNLDQAQAIAEQLRLTIANQDFKHEWHTGQPIAFTVSVGVATRAAGETDTAAILKRADEALYKAKDGGRNRVMS